LKDSPGLPKPVQKPHPPLIVGGGGPKRTPRLAATFADEFNIPFSSVADTEAQFATAAEGAPRAAGIGRKADELRANGVAGTPDEVVARLGEFAGVGAESIYLQVLDLEDLDHIALLSEEVLPRVS
jgi:alkanesulfonate monooxygenase SsuD/methylene tetrahydromethanopterin reductase-like flavin-dependent oxidoreductase (luciferase family)